MAVFDSLTQMIGHTPLLRAARFAADAGIEAELLLKLEYFNPAGSVKDRVALEMVEDAERSGKIRPGAVLIEPTSGNTGIGLAAVAAARGYSMILVMPDSMSPERRKLAAALGARVELTPGAGGMQGAIDRAEELAREIPGSFLTGQFVNPANPAAHYKTTGPEIFEDTDGRADWFVAGVGTGGTLTGTARYLKEHIPGIRAAAVEPAGSPVLSGGKAGPHGLQGIGAGFVPEILDTSLIDEVFPVTEEEAYAAARLLGKTEGVLTGITSGAALCAAVKIAKRPENKGKRIVVLLPDTGERYMSTELYADL